MFIHMTNLDASTFFIGQNNKFQNDSETSVLAFLTETALTDISYSNRSYCTDISYCSTGISH
jgi:hypothetical protein